MSTKETDSNTDAKTASATSTVEPPSAEAGPEAVLSTTVDSGEKTVSTASSGDAATGDAAVDPPEEVTNEETEASKEASEQGGDRKRRVYVGNLAWSVSWQDLKDLMKSTGHDVTRADIMMSSDGRSKGCGIVEFATAEGAAEAVSTLNDVDLKGRQIFVREDREDRSGIGSGSASTGKYNQPNQRYSQRGGHMSSSSVGGKGDGATKASGGGGDEEGQSRRVYVGNLSWDVTWQELKEHMKSAGEVVFAEIISESSGRSKGCGIVHYATEAEAQRAISTLAHTELKGRTIFVREDREGKPSSAGGSGGGSGGRPQHPSSGSNASVYVWNLSYDTSWQDLKDHMRKSGNVDSATILTDENDGSSIGCGIVVYQKPQDAQRAIRELQDSELDGRPLKLREDRGGSGRGGGRGAARPGHFGGRGGGRYGGRGGGFNRPQHSGAPSGSNEPAQEGTQLYVGNLPYDANWRDLKEHFSAVGEVQRAFVKTSETGRSKGFGIVRFAKPEDAEKAIETLNGVEFQGRALDVRMDNKV